VKLVSTHPERFGGASDSARGIDMGLDVEDIGAVNDEQALSLTNLRKAKWIGTVTAKEFAQLNLDVGVVTKCRAKLLVPLALALAIRCAEVVLRHADQLPETAR